MFTGVESTAGSFACLLTSPSSLFYSGGSQPFSGLAPYCTRFSKRKKKKHFGGTLTNKIVLEPLYPIRFLFPILSIFRPQPRMFLCILEYLGVSISKSISFKICFFSHFTAIVVGYLHTLCINNTTLNH